MIMQKSDFESNRVDIVLTLHTPAARFRYEQINWLIQ